MDDLTNTAAALELAAILNEHKGKDVVIIDLRSILSWTDFFVIATVTSSAHRAGLQKHVKDWARQAGFEPHSSQTRRGGVIKSQSGWSWTDLGEIVVHLMNEKEREFYELENLWSEGKITRI